MFLQKQLLLLENSQKSLEILSVLHVVFRSRHSCHINCHTHIAVRDWTFPAGDSSP